MKLDSTRDAIKNAVLQTERMTGKNLSLPVLGGILLTASKNSLIFRATNLDLGIEVKIPAKVEVDGSVVIPVGVLSGILSSVYDQKVSLSSQGENLLVTTVNTKSLVKCLPSEDFPTLPSVSHESSFSIPIESFIDGVKSVWYSASVSDMKPEIASICLYPEGGYLVFVATDSFRLAEKKVSIKKQLTFPHILIPYKNITEIIRVFEGKVGEVEIHFRKNQISFSLDGIYITSRIIDGIFPDYQQIIPKEYVTEATILKQDLLNGLKVTTIFSDKFNRVDLLIDVAEKKMTIESKNSTVGENSTIIDASVTGENIHCGFNQKYIMDCFPSLKQDSILLRFSGEGRPLVIHGMNDSSFIYLLMPLST